MTLDETTFLRKADQQLGYLHEYFYRDFQSVDALEITEDKREDKRWLPENAEWRPAAIGDHWEGRDRYYWLRFKLTLPQYSANQHYVMHMDLGRTGGGNNSGFEGLVFLNGEPHQAVDSNHEDMYLDHTFCGQTLDVAIKLWTGLEGGGAPVIQHYVLRALQAGIINQTVVDCYDYLWNMVGVIREMDADEPLKYDYISVVRQSFRTFDWAQETSATIGETCQEVLTHIQHFIQEHANQKKQYTITAVGHTHIDVAWLWRLRHTREKIARSFSTVLELMKEYPDYQFFQSTPQDYAFLEADYPDLYKQILQRIKEGRWEADGATWLEPDTNLPSGESLTRQFLYGMGYFHDKLNAKQHVLWLPDVFGYSAALPQILQEFGIPNFMTTKISWNDTNRMPHDTFYWRGIDGSRVLTHFITTVESEADFNDPMQWRYTYNGDITPRTVLGTYHVYADKQINDDLLLSYGYGDGGGGPTREQIKNIDIINQLPGMPTVKNGRVDDYFARLQDKLHHTDAPVAEWDGELYLEYHRGTYTSQANIKKWNRTAEYALRRLEMSYATAYVEQDVPYPHQEIRDLWIILLRNQFHDILPGSAIHEVYDDAREEFKQLFAGVADLEAKLNQQVTTSQTGQVVARNFLPWDVETLIKLSDADRDGAVNTANGAYALATIPALGSAVVTGKTPPQQKIAVVSNNTVRTSYYQVTYDATGLLTSITDIRNHREVLDTTLGGNVLTLYEDRPLDYDNWNIDVDYPEKAKQLQAQSVDVVENNPLFVDLAVHYAFGQSTMTQVIRLYAFSPRIDFITDVDWHERQVLLRTAFNTNIVSDSARYDIQYGNVTRATNDNTSWDQAKFETVGHKWADLSERDYGVALLNDCKYGYRVKGKQMSLTLLKSGDYPDTTADESQHTFTYSLLPHEGDFITGEVEKAGEELNDPVALLTDVDQDSLTPLFELDSEAPVALDAVKISETGNDLIVRCHDYTGTTGTVMLKPHFKYDAVQRAHLNEQEAEALTPDENGNVLVNFKPYKIVTLRFTLG